MAVDVNVSLTDPLIVRDFESVTDADLVMDDVGSRVSVRVTDHVREREKVGGRVSVSVGVSVPLETDDVTEGDTVDVRVGVRVVERVDDEVEVAELEDVAEKDAVMEEAVWVQGAAMGISSPTEGPFQS